MSGFAASGCKPAVASQRACRCEVLLIGQSGFGKFAAVMVKEGGRRPGYSSGGTWASCGTLRRALLEK